MGGNIEQCRLDGSLTGRKSFIDNNGTLCGIEIAETKRLQSILDYAHELLAELKSIVDNSNDDKTKTNIYNELIGMCV